MRFHEVITKEIQRRSGGLSIAGTVRAVVAANVNEKGGARTVVRARDRVTTVERGDSHDRQRT